MNDPKVIAAIIAAAVSVLTVFLSFLLKAWFERYFTLFKLEAEHRYEQKKQIKQVIARNKTHLLNAAESLNHRLWNFADNYNKGWHVLEDLSNLPQQYYFASFVYRFIEFFAWVRRVEMEMVFLDTTIATSSDLSFVKYLRLANQVMCDVGLFDGLEYDGSHDTDHFFKNNFLMISEVLWDGDRVFTFDEFKANKNSCLEQVVPVSNFLNGLSSDEACLRWDRLFSLHYVLLMFLNAYGYDFQVTDSGKVSQLEEKLPRPIRTRDNLRRMIEKVKLENEKSVKAIMK